VWVRFRVTALNVRSPNNKLYACGYLNCDAVGQNFLTGKENLKNSRKRGIIGKLSMMRKRRPVLLFLGGIILLMI
jgi:hypothetical protein